MNFYNENDPYAAQWLRNLITAGLIPQGHVDDRSIKEVQSDDLKGYTQCHWFAGAGGWCEGLRLAGISPDEPLWTGSPPCQDNSVAAAIHGKRAGLRGVRSGLAHVWLDLVEAAKPSVVLFENVPGIKAWQAEITGRLEGLGYVVPVRYVSAACAGAPHSRRRVWIAAHRHGARLPFAGSQRPSASDAQPWPAPPRGVWQTDHSAAGVLDDGFSNRVAAIRAFGNAVVPAQVAAFLHSELKG